MGVPGGSRSFGEIPKEPCSTGLARLCCPDGAVSWEEALRGLARASARWVAAVGGVLPDSTPSVVKSCSSVELRPLEVERRKNCFADGFR